MLEGVRYTVKGPVGGSGQAEVASSQLVAMVTGAGIVVAAVGGVVVLMVGVVAVAAVVTDVEMTLMVLVVGGGDVGSLNWGGKGRGGIWGRVRKIKILKKKK